MKTNKDTKAAIPKFASTSEEAEWWDTHSTVESLKHGKEVGVKIKKPLMHVFAVRLGSDDVRMVSDSAEEAGVGFSTMLRMLVKERLRERAADSARSEKTVKGRAGKE